MATANVNKFCLEMEIPEISKLDIIWSPKISIHGIPWEVEVCKKEQKLTAFLFCANQDRSPDWSLWGAASFKLLSFSDDARPVQYHTSPFVFNSSGVGCGTNALINCNDLFNPDKKYVKNDTIKLEIKVTAENPNDPNRSQLDFKCVQKCCGNSDHATFRLTVTNVLKLVTVQSPQFTLYGLTWDFTISKLRSFNLGVLLELNEQSDKVTCEMAMTIKLVSSKKDAAKKIEKCVTKQYQHSKNISAVDVVSWDEMVKPENGFVNDNSITLEVKIQANKPEGDDGTPIAKRAKLNPQKQAANMLQCPICLMDFADQDIAVTTCGHMFCFECIKTAVTGRAACPMCNKAIRLHGLRQIYLPSAK